jgi:hypothetical protein
MHGELGDLVAEALQRRDPWGRGGQDGGDVDGESRHGGSSLRLSRLYTPIFRLAESTREPRPRHAK